jgi:DNA segregation ATPase FtsK/SpoIIIE-like protein
MSVEAKSILARFLDSEVIEDEPIPQGKPAPDHTSGQRGATKLTIQERFELFHRNNPVIYELFCEYARAARAKGHEKLGIQFIAERIRWRLTVETEDRNSKFKINQDYLSRYSRLIEEQETDLKDFFTKRALVTR